jgi:hypothetical protein
MMLRQIDVGGEVRNMSQMLGSLSGVILIYNSTIGGVVTHKKILNTRFPVFCPQFSSQFLMLVASSIHLLGGTTVAVNPFLGVIGFFCIIHALAVLPP